MNRSHRVYSSQVAVILLSLPIVAAARADELRIEPREVWGNLFAGKEAHLRFAVKADRAWKGRASWSWTTLNDRTIVNGEAEVAVTPDKPAQIEIRLPAPKVKPGAALRTNLRISLTPAGAQKPDTTHDKVIWVLPDDPFHDRKDWLKDRKIHLFDPEKTTATSLEKLGVPFEELPGVPALAALKEGLVLVGEGVSFKDHADLAAGLLQAAEAGRPVLCLAPAGGSFPVPGAGARNISWKKQDVISELDKRLDSTAWPPSGVVVARSFTQKAEDGAVVAEVAAGAGGWPWLEVEYPNRGRLLICGFGIFGKPWDAGPAPRYLFARMLEHVSRKPDEAGVKETEK